MPVPFAAGSREDRDLLLGQPGALEAFAAAKDCDLVVAGIGTAEPDASLVASGMIEPAEIDAIRRLGGVGELLGHFFDERGRPVETELLAAHRHLAPRLP